MVLIKENLTVKLQFSATVTLNSSAGFLSSTKKIDIAKL